MRFIVDMNLSPRWVEYLREAGFDAEHWSTVGEATATDALIMRTAQDQGAVVLTNDLDFAEHAGLIECRWSQRDPDSCC